jgi:[protein-PII] uridylyltransferase
LGVYDWFEVKPPAVLKGLDAKLVRLVTGAKPSVAEASGASLSIFEEIECVAASESEWVVSFRGRDSRGALLHAVEALLQEGLSILWAKVHTWGRQIDDVFGVRPVDRKPDELVRSLRARVANTKV